MTLFRHFKEDRRSLLLSMPLSSRRLWRDAPGFVPTGTVYSHLWQLLCPPVYLLSHLPSQQHVQVSTPASLSAQSSPFTAACPGQHTRQSICSVISLHSSTPASLSAQSSPFTAACPGQHTRQSICSVISLHSSMSRAAHPQSFQRGMSTNDTFQPGLPFPLFVTSWLNLWGWQHVVRLTLLEENQWRAWVTAFTFTVKLHNSKKSIWFLFQLCQHHPVVPTSSEVIDNWNCQP